FLTNTSECSSSRLSHDVSWYRNTKKTPAQIPNPAKCHFRGLMPPSRQRPKMAEIVVSRDASNPIHPPSGDGRKFSGTSAVAQNDTVDHHSGKSHYRHQLTSFLRGHSS